MNHIFSLLAYPHALKLDLKLSDSMILAAICQNSRSNRVKVTDFRITEQEIQLDLEASIAFVRKSFQIRFVIQQVYLASEELIVDIEVQNEVLTPLLSALKMLKLGFVSMLEVKGKNVRINLSRQLAEMLQKQDPALRDYLQQIRISEIRQEEHFLFLSAAKD